MSTVSPIVQPPSSTWTKPFQQIVARMSMSLTSLFLDYVNISFLRPVLTANTLLRARVAISNAQPILQVFPTQLHINWRITSIKRSGFFCWICKKDPIKDPKRTLTHLLTFRPYSLQQSSSLHCCLLQSWHAITLSPSTTTPSPITTTPQPTHNINTYSAIN